MIKKLKQKHKLSILIPVYNFKVVDLVKKLYKQCEKLDMEFEILVFDDGSAPKYKEANQALNSYFGVNYMEMSENLGRSKIRNWLIKSALYDFVLFLDCDSKVTSKDFIQKYLAELAPNRVINGGRIYANKKPKAKSKYLHWLYGSKKESRKSSVRNKNAHLYFHSNNFAADRKVMIEFPFDESIKGYGYEDLLIAQNLMDHDVQVKHIDNPIIHLGLEKNKDFLDKNLQAVSNLVSLKKQGLYLNTNLDQFAFKLKDWSLDNILFNYLEKKKDQFTQNLLGDKPSLRKFQLLKLHRYLDELKAK